MHLFPFMSTSGENISPAYASKLSSQTTFFTGYILSSIEYETKASKCHKVNYQYIASFTIKITESYNVTGLAHRQADETSRQA